MAVQILKSENIRDTDRNHQMACVSELSGERLAIAEQARRAAMEILEDALRKGFYGFPVSFFYTCSEPVDSYKFCCIPTQKMLTDILKKMGEIKFMADSDPECSEVFAYVIPALENNIVYLCHLFWDSPDDLCRDSKPGTLIHEVSHLFGTEDISYNELTVELFENHGTLLGRSSSIQSDDGQMYRPEEAVQVNANSLEHEFETTINHQKPFLEGRYACCGETKRNTVCKSRSTGHYHLHTHFESKKKEMEEKIRELQNSVARNDQLGIFKYVKIKNQPCKKYLIPSS